MASLLLLLALPLTLLLASTPLSSGNWCVCKDGSDTVLQKTLDYACGAGADCNPIRQNGPCFQPNTVRAHCNYAVNSYFQRKSQSAATCDFSGTATLTSSNPSTSSACVYPSSATNAGGTSSTGTTSPTGSTSSTTTGSTMPSSSSTTTTATPYGIGGIGGGGGLGPSAAGMNSDDSHGGLRVVDTCFYPCVSALLLSCLFMIQLLWG